MAVDRGLEPVGAVEILPIGLEHRDRVALALDAHLHLRDLLGPVQALVLDRIGVGGRADEADHGDDVEEADHRRAPLSGSEARASSAVSGSCGGASVRSAARSFAERARGFRAASASLAATGPFVTATKLAAAASPRGKWRERPGRTARNCFTIRSSSE